MAPPFISRWFKCSLVVQLGWNLARTKVREGELHCPPGPNPRVPFDRLLVYLYKLGSPTDMWLLRELLVWAAWVLELGGVWGEASAEAEDLPAPRGPKRARRMNPRYLDGIAKLAGEGKVGRTGARLTRVLRLAERRRKAMYGVAERTGNQAVITRAKRYRECAAEAMQHGRVQVLSVSFDASRVDGKDTLYSALWSPQQGLGCWGDPMVPGAKQGKLKRPFSQKLKATILG